MGSLKCKNEGTVGCIRHKATVPKDCNTCLDCTLDEDIPLYDRRKAIPTQPQPIWETNMYKVLKFSAGWCKPCSQLAATLEGQDLGVEITSVDIDEQPEIATSNSIRGVPTMVLFSNDTEIARISGSKSLGEIKAWLLREMV